MFGIDSLIGQNPILTDLGDFFSKITNPLKDGVKGALGAVGDASKAVVEVGKGAVEIVKKGVDAGGDIIKKGVDAAGGLASKGLDIVGKTSNRLFDTLSSPVFLILVLGGGALVITMISRR